MISAITIIFFLILIIIIISWILNAAKVTVPITNGSHTTQQQIKALGLVDWFYAPIKGFVTEPGLLIFIISIGGFIFLVIETKSLDALIQRIAAKLKNHYLILIPVLMLLFSFLGTTEGFGEEKIPLYIVIIPIFLALGSDKMTGFLTLMVGAGIGVMGATVNPFEINVAFNASGLYPQNVTPEYTTGMVWRIVGYLVFTITAISFVTFYAYRVHNHPSKSVTFRTYETDKKYFLKKMESEIKLTAGRKWTVAILFLVLAIMVFYLINWDSLFNTNFFQNGHNWFQKHAPFFVNFLPGVGHGDLDATAPFFIIASIVVALINRLSEKQFINFLMQGYGSLLILVIVIATAFGVGFILTNSYIEQLIIYELKSTTNNVAYTPQLLIFFIAFLPISFLIPSQAGMLSSVFKIIGPIIGLKHLSGTVAAACWASGLINLIAPSSFVLMTALDVAKTDYRRLVKVIWPLILILICECIILLTIGTKLPSGIF